MTASLTHALDGYRTQLEASGITLETAARCGVRAVSADEARDLGFRGNGFDGADLKGLLFPYVRPDKKVVTYELRPDLAHEGRKYLHLPGTTNYLYTPGALPEQITDARFDALITEGAKKYLCLLETVGTKYLPIGLSGVWNWRTSDKAKQAERDHPGTKWTRENSRPIADLERVAWKGRKAYLLFDSDARNKPDVQKAEMALAAELRRRGAVPMIVSIPPGPHGEKQGIDDLLATLPRAERLKALEQLLRSAAPRRKLAPDSDRRLTLDYYYFVRSEAECSVVLGCVSSTTVSGQTGAP